MSRCQRIGKGPKLFVRCKGHMEERQIRRLRERKKLTRAEQELCAPPLAGKTFNEELFCTITCSLILPNK